MLEKKASKDGKTCRTRPTVAAIIPAYNEAKRLGGVLDALRRTPLLDEIIVVDDGSDDVTAQIAQQASGQDRRVRLVQHESNHGKGQAVFTGWAATQASILLLLDADLYNLSPRHIEALILPILAGEAGMTLGLFRGGHLNTDLAHWFTPWLTGQRCLRADLIQHIVPEAASGYGFETALTIAAQQQHVRTLVVPLRGVWHPPSELHRGLKNGARRRISMYSQILRAWRIIEGTKIRRSFAPLKAWRNPVP